MYASKFLGTTRTDKCKGECINSSFSELILNLRNARNKVENFSITSYNIPDPYGDDLLNHTITPYSNIYIKIKYFIQ